MKLKYPCDFCDLPVCAAGPNCPAVKDPEKFFNKVKSLIDKEIPPLGVDGTTTRSTLSSSVATATGDFL